MTREELVGLPIDQATALTRDDATLPMSLDFGPTQRGTMTLYEFSGGLTSLLVIARDGVVSRVDRVDLDF